MECILTSHPFLAIASCILFLILAPTKRLKQTTISLHPTTQHHRIPPPPNHSPPRLQVNTNMKCSGPPLNLELCKIRTYLTKNKCIEYQRVLHFDCRAIELILHTTKMDGLHRQQDVCCHAMK